MSYYIKTHMPLVFETWSPFGLTRWEVLSHSDKLDGSEAGYAVQALLYWEDEGRAKRAVDGGHEEAKTVFGDVKNFSNEEPVWFWGRSEGKSS